MKDDIILNNHDVLFGRGSAMSQFIGTRRFRDLCDARKQEYNNASRNKHKSAIAQELLDQVHTLGGRFLQVQEDGDAANLEDRSWEEVPQSKALTKIKQTLRQIERYPPPSIEVASSKAPQESRPSDGQAERNLKEEGDGEPTGAPEVSLNASVPESFTTREPSSQPSAVPPSLLLETTATTEPSPVHQKEENERETSSMSGISLNPSTNGLSSLQPPNVDANASVATLPVLPPSLVASDPRLALLQQILPLNLYADALMTHRVRLELEQQSQAAKIAIAESLLAASSVPDFASLSLAQASFPSPQEQQQQQLMKNQISVLAQMAAAPPNTSIVSRESTLSPISDDVDEMETQYSPNETDTSLPGSIVSNVPPETTGNVPTTTTAGEEEDDVSEFLMSVLQLSGLPRFTNHKEERANMTGDEKAAALSDMFGKYCSVDTHKNKRARQGYDGESISFLVKEMRAEVDKIHHEQKEALVKALQVCDMEEEFSDERLERFLRCEGMDPTLGAMRLVRYWESRCEVFGPEKYVMKMTLSEALSDDCDLIALEFGWLRLLPTRDASGRQLLVKEPARHKREGYTTENMLRAAWYTLEVASRSPNPDCGLVELIWDKNSTIWDYDHELYKKYFFFCSSCWPINYECFHVCCSPKFIARVVIPICSALQGKEGRIRSVWHDVSEDGIVAALSEYGITRQVLPETFGGTLFFNQSDWISQRRALEMEEI